ncbi:RrF2 family transcriptional regulator [Calidifontibacillus erzurumensis]|uniref:RrF2 family transcriptional regulator n=1 Tax=Calidifontibacillus erzurumensis TaxID=2741433 RepID=UPI0035B5685F
MKLTKSVEQAICILIFLVTQEKNEPLATDEISNKLNVSPSYLKKITRKLVKKKIITSVSGNRGGISLAKSPEEINMLDIIEAMEGPISIYSDTGLIETVFKGGKHTDKGSDILRNVFKQADLLLIEYFSKITAADLLKESFGTENIPTLNWNKMSLTEYVEANCQNLSENEEK